VRSPRYKAVNLSLSLSLFFRRRRCDFIDSGGVFLVYSAPDFCCYISLFDSIFLIVLPSLSLRSSRLAVERILCANLALLKAVKANLSRDLHRHSLLVSNHLIVSVFKFCVPVNISIVNNRFASLLRSWFDRF
jgi:hypothetical protein